MNNLPIAVFDSGLGGLSVWRVLRRELPNESLIYFGDGKNCPYGDKPYEEVVGYVDEAVQFLMRRGVKMLVVACNAATAVAIAHLRATYPIPIVGMEPAVKPAALASQSGVIGILATAATLNGGLFRHTASQYSDKVKIVSAVGEGFVELVESDGECSTQAIEIVEKAMRPMLNEGADQIVLGCTHYPFLRQAMEKVIGDKTVTIVDPAPAVERRVKQLLEQFDLAAEPENVPSYEFYTADNDDYLQRLITKSDKLF